MSMLLASGADQTVSAVMMLGVIAGMQYGLLAIGLVLVYKAGRYINMAHGQLGLIAAAVLARLVVVDGWSYWTALPVALATGVAVGAAVERLVIQRLFRASRLVLLLATLAVSQLLFVIASGIIPSVNTVRSGGGYPVPFHATRRVGLLTVSSAQLLTLVVAPVLVTALALFFTRTASGRAVRAASSNADAARLAGISVRRVSLLVWCVAGALSAITAILAAPDQSALDLSTAGPGLLLRGLAAALVGGLVSMPRTFVAAIAIGIVEQAAIWRYGPTVSDLIVLAVILIAVVLRSKQLAGVAPVEDQLSELSSEPLSARLSELHLARNLGRYGWAALLAAALALMTVPGFQTQSEAQLMTQLVAYAMIGVSLTVLTGWTGLVSLGQFAFLGVGAYAAASAADHGWSLLGMLLAAGGAAALAAMVVGVPALRFRGLTLAVTTLGFAVVGQSWLFRKHLGGGGSGLATISDIRLFYGGPVLTKRELYVIAVVLLALLVAALSHFRRTGAGRRLIAARENEAALAAHGQTPWVVRLSALAISGFIAGLAGCLWGSAQGGWQGTSFDPATSLILLSMTVVGGARTLHGPILGALAVWGWPFLVPDQNTAIIRALCAGLLLLVILLFEPAGIAGLLTNVRRVFLNWLERGLPPRFRADLSAPPLQVTGLHLAFGGLKAVDDVSLQVAQGEIVGLIGGNGAGKSTLMNAISGHARPASGQVLVFGQDVSKLPPEYRTELGVARSFQNALLYPSLTVREAVLLAVEHADPTGTLGALVGAPWVRAAEGRKRLRVDEAITRVGLTESAELKVGSLSTGMRRLCELATIIAMRPRLVLLDEPTAGIAQREVEAFGPLIRALRDEYDCTILIIEHDIPLLLSLCDRLYALESGRIIAEGTPDEVRNNAAVIAGYLGTGVAVDRSGVGPKPAAAPVKPARAARQRAAPKPARSPAALRPAPSRETP